MKKYRVLKDIKVYKKGEEFIRVDKKDVLAWGLSLGQGEIDIGNLIDQGFIEEVKEPETLAEKILDRFKGNMSELTASCISEIAHVHFRENGWVRGADVIKSAMFKTYPLHDGYFGITIHKLEEVINSLTNNQPKGGE